VPFAILITGRTLTSILFLHEHSLPCPSIHESPLFLWAKSGRHCMAAIHNCYFVSLHLSNNHDTCFMRERERHDTWIDQGSTCGCFCFPAVGKIRGWFGLVRRGWKMHGSSKRLARSRCLPARRTNVVLVTRDATSRLVTGPLWWRTGRHYSQQTGPLWWRGFPRNGAAIFSCRPSWLSIDTLLRFLLGVKPWCSVPERCDTITLHGTTCVYRREARPVWKTQFFFFFFFS